MAKGTKQSAGVLVVGRTPTPKRKNTRWGVESEFTRRLRERQLEAIIETRCGLCHVGVRYSAKNGIRWFERHERTPGHKAAVEARDG